MGSANVSKVAILLSLFDNRNFLVRQTVQFVHQCVDFLVRHHAAATFCFKTFGISVSDSAIQCRLYVNVLFSAMLEAEHTWGAFRRQVLRSLTIAAHYPLLAVCCLPSRFAIRHAETESAWRLRRAGTVRWRAVPSRNFQRFVCAIISILLVS